MTDDFDLFRIVQEYRGPPLKMLLAGAGSYAMRILEVPGASRVLDSIFVPYAEERMDQWLLATHPIPRVAEAILERHPRVSQEMVSSLHVANCTSLGDAYPLTVTAAITSKRKRQGENQAFIAAGPPGSYDAWHVQLAKLEDVDFEDYNKVEARRFVQDRIISEVALSIATGIPSALRAEMEESGYVRKL
jgi:nicotinamide mononucleotide (NMN) deamidase PncC